MGVKWIDRTLDQNVLGPLRHLAASGLETVPRGLELASVMWDGTDQQLLSFRVLPSGELEIDLVENAQTLVSQSDAWKAGSLVAQMPAGERLIIDAAIARQIGPGAGHNIVRVHGLAWRVEATGETASADSGLWSASIDFGIFDEPHLLDLGASNLQLRTEDAQTKGWCFDTPDGLAFLVRSPSRKGWQIAFRTNNDAAPSAAQVVALSALVSFALGQPFSIGVFRRVRGADCGDMMRLHFPDLRSRNPSRRAPALPAIHGGYWLPRFVELGLRFIAREPSAPLLASIHHQLGALDGLLDSEFLHTWIAAEILAKWGLGTKCFKDSGTCQRV